MHSGILAGRVARRRCWDHDWVLDLDIKSFFDEIDWTLLMRAVHRHTAAHRHTGCKWVLLYLERWLEAPVSMPDGTLVEPERGTPQGAVVSPVLANLLLHYAFDGWMRREHPDIPFERCADDAICHCRSEAPALIVEAKHRRSLSKRSTGAHCRSEAPALIVEAKRRRLGYARRWNSGLRTAGYHCTGKRPRSFTAKMQIVLENIQNGLSIFSAIPSGREWQEIIMASALSGSSRRSAKGRQDNATRRAPLATASPPRP
jgi:hypothetical protein